MNATNMSEQDRQEIEDLLPWHAAGTLSRRDAERVEAALARDPDLARDFALAREELAEVVRENETLGAPSLRAMDTLFAAIDAEPSRRRVAFDIGARIAALFETLSPRTLAWSAAAAALVIAIQAGLIGGALIKSKPAAGVYQTASGPSAPVTPGAYVLLRFAPDARAGDITAFLDANKAVIVDGPKAGGFYRIRVATGRPADGAIDADRSATSGRQGRGLRRRDALSAPAARESWSATDHAVARSRLSAGARRGLTRWELGNEPHPSIGRRGGPGPGVRIGPIGDLAGVGRLKRSTDRRWPQGAA